MKHRFGLYVIFGDQFVKPERYEEFADEISDFADMVQLREKNISAKEYARRATGIKRILERKKVPLIINDRVDVALECGADGVHLGQNDISVSAARKILGKRSIIGLSVETRNQAKQAAQLPLDYISASPVFHTSSKADAANPLGLNGLRKIKMVASSVPVIGIGGINEENALEVIKAGASGVAVISAICGALSWRFAARKIKETICKVTR